MAAPGNKFFIQEKLKLTAPHHESFKALWETKWKIPCKMGIYPFMYGAIADFQPVVDAIVAKGLKRPYDWDEYAQCFFPTAEELVAHARAAEDEGDKEKASELYLRGSALYRIARFPAPRSEKQVYAWEKGKEAAIKGLSLERYPTAAVEIPHVHAVNGDGPTLPGFFHLPASASASSKVPLVIIFTGLDGYRTELSVWKTGWAQLGCATLVVEIPGTGDNPGAPNDPASPDRVWSSLFEWVARQEGIDQGRVINWGFSTGGYYSIRMAHTHADKLKGVVALGGGVHYMFDPEWLDAVDDLEYPFDLAHTLCHKFGYTDFEQFKKEAQDKFSLLRTGILDKPCTRLLLVNGTEDEIFPIDDYYLCLLHGGPKEARFVPGTKHMGEPESFSIILKWVFKLLDIDGDVGRFLSTIPFKPKYEVSR
ncbi:yellowish-green 1-like protein [Annulohypoxylon maeteangense]|uniref:yellowish-green 1-like protein n=1 Tax=Annulohypoxylon maeteangense TaxID=1927788 RepID=UPI0020073DD1|nr:yellowish-green 1-like protein [Annulohypoxylon maeteangense]KAI0889473.1 yellowish-green 1-like protein [Annulohypoxylon maeteangense]